MRERHARSCFVAVDCVLRANAPLVRALNHIVGSIDAFLDLSMRFSLEMAVQNGSISLFDRVLRRLRSALCAPQERERLQCEIELGLALKLAVELARLDLVKRIHVVYPRPLSYQVLRSAAAAGDVVMLEWLLHHRTDGLCIDEPAEQAILVSGKLSCCLRFVYYAALNTSQLHVVRWLFERGYIDMLEGAGDAAAAAGDLGVVRWVDAQQEPRSFSTDAMDNAACRGHLRIVQFLLDHRSEGYTAVGVHGAITGNYEEIATVLRGARQLTNSDDLSVMVVHAAAAGQLDILTSDACRQVENLHLEIAVYAAAEHGHVEVVSWLVTEIQLTFPPAARASAAGNGHLSLLQWVHKHTQDRWSVDVLNRAAQHGRLEIVQWLHDNRNDGCTASAMNGAAANGHLEVVKWLHFNRTEGCSTEAMNGAAIHGHLDVVRWLHENRIEGCTVEAMNEAAANGHVEVVKWLHIHAPVGCSKRAMDQAAHGGHLAVLQFLHAFRHEGCSSQAAVGAATFGHLRVVDWLKENYPVVYDPAMVADGCMRWKRLRDRAASASERAASVRK